MQVLMCDVGGTNIRFGIFSPDSEKLIFDKKYKCTEFSSFEEAVATYLKTKTAKPEMCVVGAAGDIDEKGQNVITTNTPWKVSLPKLKTSFPQFIDSHLVNDFALQGWALAEMTPNQYQFLFEAKPTDLSKGNILMIGPGTGLGSCLILQDPETGIQAVHTAESGHMNVPYIRWKNPQDNRDNYRVLNSIEDFYQTKGSKMVVEHLTSGTGISNIYHALRDGKIPQEKEKRIFGQKIEELAKAGDSTALKTFDMFFAYLGAQTGSLVSTIKAKKVFFNGGVMASEWIINRMQETSYFKEQVVNRAGMTPFMKDVQFIVSKELDMAILGCKVCAKKMILANKSTPSFIGKHEMMHIQKALERTK